MNGRYVLDTNIVIALFRGEPNVREELTTASEVFVPVVANAELLFGARRSTQAEQNLQQIRQFADGSSILTCDMETAEHYGVIKSQLKSIGRPIPENDIWIAALAQQRSATLVSRDQHFAMINTLAQVAW